MEMADVQTLHVWENASEDWWMGASILPVSVEAMTQFATGNHDLYRDRQWRWMLDARAEKDAPWHAVGAVDLYDFEPRQLRAGVAVHVDHAHRRQGHALEGLGLLEAYAVGHLGLRQLYAEVPANHEASLRLFERAGYVATGKRAQWIRTPHGAWSDVVTMQLFFNEPSKQPS